MASKHFVARTGQKEIYSGNSMGYSIFSIYADDTSTCSCWRHSSVSILGSRSTTIGV